VADAAELETFGSRPLADACTEIPYVEGVTYSIRRLVATRYLPRFAHYLRGLGFTEAEAASVVSLTPTAAQRLVHEIGERAGWVADPTAHLRQSGCRLALTVADDAESTTGVPAPDPARLLDRLADLPLDVRAFLGVDPHRPGSLDRALALAGHPACCGIALTPFSACTPIDDDAYAPALAAAETRDLPVWVHSSAHYWPSSPIDAGHPRRLDRVLQRHPELRLVLGHAGWPWTDEACIVAVRHERVALEFSTFAPRALRDPGWSLGALLANRRVLPGRIFFGSGAIAEPTEYARLVTQLDDLPLGDQGAAWRGAGLMAWLGGRSGSGR
jgi:uncharacterized protein